MIQRTKRTRTLVTSHVRCKRHVTRDPHEPRLCPLLCLNHTSTPRHARPSRGATLEEASDQRRADDAQTRACDHTDARFDARFAHTHAATRQLRTSAQRSGSAARCAHIRLVAGGPTSHSHSAPAPVKREAAHLAAHRLRAPSVGSAPARRHLRRAPAGRSSGPWWLPAERVRARACVAAMNDRKTIELEEGWAIMQVRLRSATRARGASNSALRAARSCAPHQPPAAAQHPRAAHSVSFARGAAVPRRARAHPASPVALAPGSVAP